MDRTDALWEVLRTEFGIDTEAELDEAIRRQGKLDISIFCCPVSRNEGNVRRKGLISNG